MLCGLVRDGVLPPERVGGESMETLTNHRVTPVHAPSPKFHYPKLSWSIVWWRLLGRPFRRLQCAITGHPNQIHVGGEYSPTGEELTGNMVCTRCYKTLYIMEIAKYEAQRRELDREQQGRREVRQPQPTNGESAGDTLKQPL